MTDRQNYCEGHSALSQCRKLASRVLALSSLDLTSRDVHHWRARYMACTMEAVLRRHGLRTLVAAPPRICLRQMRRTMATAVDGGPPAINAAAEFPEEDGKVVLPSRSRPSRFGQVRGEMIETPADVGKGGREQRRNSSSSIPRRGGRGGNQDDPLTHPVLRRIRIVPASPSYFTATPRYIDDLLSLSALLRKYQLLPVLPPGDAPRVAWKTIDQYKTEVAEPVRAKSYKMLLELLKRLNYIHPSLIPADVTQTLEKYKRVVQPHHNRPKPILVDKFGRSKAVGRRKSSVASVFVVEGEGKVLVNGKPLTDYFGRLHDRESAVWALKATQRMDKYNVWALARGGGTTGQADAIALGLSKALLAHEPDLKPALRRGEHSTSNPSVNLFPQLTPLQHMSLHAILEAWNERSLASSRLARCLPGSSVNICLYHCITILYSRQRDERTLLFFTTPEGICLDWPRTDSLLYMPTHANSASHHL